MKIMNKDELNFNLVLQKDIELQTKFRFEKEILIKVYFHFLTLSCPTLGAGSRIQI